jgi:AraC-like DNA-binding protein
MAGDITPSPFRTLVAGTRSLRVQPILSPGRRCPPGRVRSGQEYAALTDPYRMDDILLINMNQNETEPEVVRLLGNRLRFHCVSDVGVIADTVRTVAPLALCFEYDYPDIPRLAALQETKLAYPSLPIVMVTQQHSEELAVWAFRSRVWDYFVKPLPVADLLECFGAIQALPRRKAPRASREFSLRKCALPHDTRFQATPQSKLRRVVNEAISYVERNLHNRICQAEIAERCGMSSSQFSRAFKEGHGTTFQEYVLQRRVNQAVRLLRNPAASITDICYTVGFNDQSHFTRMFRRYVGVSPSSYRKRLQNAHDSLLPLAGNY